MLNQFKQNKKMRNITKCKKKFLFYFIRTKSGTFKTTDLQIGTSGLKSEGSDTLSENSEEDFLEHEKIAYEDLEISKKKLGSGATASVYKVKYGKKFYALKVSFYFFKLSTGCRSLQ
jgi:hypothetical protein